MPSRLQATTVHVAPAIVEVTSRETVPIAFDAAPLLLVGESVSLPTSVLTDLTTGLAAPLSLSGAPVAVASVVTQTVTGLTAGHDYRLSVGFTAAAGKVRDMLLFLRCVA